MDRKSYLEGLSYGAAAYFMWGLLPLYWRLVDDLSAYQIFFQRVIWSLVFVGFLLWAKGMLKGFVTQLKNPKVWRNGTAAALFISINWLTYIWGVNNGFVIEASLGYYINPLVLTLFGKVFFKEKMTSLQKLGIISAAIGVVLSTWFYQRIPFVGLTLAVSFAVYGVLKKQSDLDPLSGLGLETLIVGIPSVIVISFLEISGKGITGNLPGWFWFLIAFSGVATSVPLICYAQGAKRLPLNVLGFLQYISPTIGLVLGIIVFGEPFNHMNLFAFCFIWLGLVIFTISQLRLVSKENTK